MSSLKIMRRAFVSTGSIFVSVLLLQLIGWATTRTAQAAGLEAAWNFDETGGMVAHDGLGRFDGVLSGAASFVPGGISGNALRLQSVGDGFVDMGNVLGLTETSFALVAWVKTDPGDLTENMVVLAKHEGYINDGYFLDVNRSTAILGQPSKAFFFAGDPYSVPISSTSVNDGLWHQLVGVHEVGGNNLLYIDGLLESTVAALPVLSGPAPFLIGGVSFSGKAQGLFTGLIDEVQVYSRVLSAGEVALLYGAKKGSRLLNIDFAAHLNSNLSPKVGVAAIGATSSDFWNGYSPVADASGTLRATGQMNNLLWADRSVSLIDLVVENAAGFGSTDSDDQMMQSYLASLSEPGELLVTLNQVPPGFYDLYLYAHGLSDMDNGLVQVLSGAWHYGVKATSPFFGWNRFGWVDRNQFVLFQQVEVSAGEPVVIKVAPGMSGLAVMNGLQLRQTLGPAGSRIPLGTPVCIQ